MIYKAFLILNEPKINQIVWETINTHVTAVPAHTKNPMAQLNIEKHIAGTSLAHLCDNIAKIGVRFMRMYSEFTRYGMSVSCCMH